MWVADNRSMHGFANGRYDLRHRSRRNADGHRLGNGLLEPRLRFEGRPCGRANTSVAGRTGRASRAGTITTPRRREPLRLGERSSVTIRNHHRRSLAMRTYVLAGGILLATVAGAVPSRA